MSNDLSREDVVMRTELAIEEMTRTNRETVVVRNDRSEYAICPDYVDRSGLLVSSITQRAIRSDAYPFYNEYLCQFKIGGFAFPFGEDGRFMANNVADIIYRHMYC